MRKCSQIETACLGIVLAVMSAGAAEKPLNVVFIGVDDLRVQLNSYGYTQMKTPNFDRLATLGMQFNRAYVQQAVCAASRASLLTGCRPETTGVDYPYTPWFNETFRTTHLPIAEFFTDKGYYTRTLGKIHHGPVDKNLSEEHFKDPCYQFALPEHQDPSQPKWKANSKLTPWEHADLPDHMYSDGQIAGETIATIRRAIKQDQPFFIAPGFKKPHLPFVCPKKYYDLYSDEDIQLAPHPELGPNQPGFTITGNTGASKWWHYPTTGIDEENARHLIHSYYACVSFVDAQLGKILDELESQNLMSSTVIVLWGDHGWHLGDQGMWGKSTCYEWATRTPFFAYVPGMKEAGKQTDALVEFVDMFPTLLALCGLEIPEYLEGTSFVPLLNDAGQPWKTAAFSQFPRSTSEYGQTEAFSVRTKDFRYSQWRKQGSGDIVFEELYDERDNLLEAENVAANPEYKPMLEEHRKIMAAGWKAALPPGSVNTSNLPRGDDTWYYLKKPNKKQVKSKKGEANSKTGEVTSENKEWVADLFKRVPEADADGNGVLTKTEAKAYKEQKK